MSKNTKLIALLERLLLLKLDFKNPNAYKPEENEFSHITDNLFEATVAGSMIEVPPEGWDGGKPKGHALLLDIDHEAWLVPSSTEGHSHLYIDVPGGISHEVYMKLLGVLAEAGVIEKEYAEVSQKRGYTALRLPWIKKDPKRAASETTTIFDPKDNKYPW